MINWILVPVCNGLHLTQAAVKTFLKQDIHTRVLLIDNASQDGTAEWARSMYPQVVTIRKNPPLSVAQSWNKGLSILFDTTYQDPEAHILVCNNDVELRPDTYRRLIEDGGEFVTAVSVGSREQMQQVDPRGKRPHPDFSCYLIRKSVWEKVGKFDEDFRGAFCEDWDYHVRMHKAGVDVYCIDVPYYHVGSATIKAMTPEDQDRLCKQAEANRAYFKHKWGVAGGSPEYYALFNQQVDHGCDH